MVTPNSSSTETETIVLLHCSYLATTFFEKQIGHVWTKPNWEFVLWRQLYKFLDRLTFQKMCRHWVRSAEPMTSQSLGQEEQSSQSTPSYDAPGSVNDI
jgi:hypothetical protein